MTFRFPTMADYTEAYRGRRRSPLDIAKRVLSAVAASEDRDLPLRLFISQSEADVLAQAEASSARYEAGEALGPLDGVPIAVKDEIDQAGYPTTVGTRFLGARGAVAKDSAAVARLRAAGALLIGKTNMQEIGIGVTGINPHHGAVRNPYGPGHITGGSSSGSGAAVAAGICPVAIGADGGGSIRIPAALCGVSGIKPTFGRVSELGAAPLCWSLAHLGPLAASLADAAHVLQLIAGVDPADPSTLGQPNLDLNALIAEGQGGEVPSVEGLRVGWCPAWAAKADPNVVAACEAAVSRLEARGATRVDVDLAHLDLHGPVQYVTIGVEMATSQYEFRREHLRDYGADTRLLLEMASQVPAVEYIRAQRLRTLIHDELVRVFDRVDVLATPAVAQAAAAIPPSALETGLSDDRILEANTTFSFAANLSGQPAISIPVGYDEAGLPLGLQLLGRHWDEATIIRCGLAVEAGVSRQRPRVYYALLD